mmetsp:Transcript_4856/g.17615  ORF Transcript_4856/g.17615 Transcript_4856/m.17615 type:complete len:219 (-) Transcript_4856:1151-1807(-)
MQHMQQPRRAVELDICHPHDRSLGGLGHQNRMHRLLLGCSSPPDIDLRRLQGCDGSSSYSAQGVIRIPGYAQVLTLNLPLRPSAHHDPPGSQSFSRLAPVGRQVVSGLDAFKQTRRNNRHFIWKSPWLPALLAYNVALGNVSRVLVLVPAAAVGAEILSEDCRALGTTVMPPSSQQVVLESVIGILFHPDSHVVQSSQLIGRFVYPVQSRSLVPGRGF